MADLRFSATFDANVSDFIGGIRVSEKEFTKFVNDLDKFDKAFSELGKGGASFLGDLKKFSPGNVFKSLKEDLRGLKDGFIQNIKSAGEFLFAIKNIASSVDAALAPFKKIVSIGAEFEYGMDQVQAALGGTEAEMASLTAMARKLGSDTQFSATQAAEGMKFLSLSGFKANQVMAAMPGLLDLAAASGEGLGTVSEIVSDQLNAMKLSADQTGRMANVFAKASAMSSTGVAQLGESMKYSAPQFQVAGQSLETLTAATAMLANVGLKGTMSGTALRMALTRLAVQPKPAREALEELGISVKDNSGNFLDLSEILKKFATKLGPTIKAVGDLRDSNGQLMEFDDIMTKVTKTGMGAADKLKIVAQVFGTESSSAMLELIQQSQVVTDEFGNKLPTAFERFRGELENSNGAAREMAAILMDNLKGDLDTLSSTVEEMALTIYDSLQPTLRFLTQELTTGIGQATSFIKGLFTVFSAFGEGISAGLAPAREALQTLFLAFQPLRDALQPIFSQWSAGTQQLTVFQAVAYAVGYALSTVVSVGIVPLIQGLQLLVPIVTSVATAIISFGQVLGTGFAAFNDLTVGLSVFEKIQYAVLSFGYWITGINWSASGQALITTFVDGVVAQGQSFYNAVLSVFDWISQLLPHSNAAAGPLSTLFESGQALIMTISEGVMSVGQALYSAVSSIFTPVAAGLASLGNTFLRFSIVVIPPIVAAIGKLALGFLRFGSTLVAQTIGTAIGSILAKLPELIQKFPTLLLSLNKLPGGFKIIGAAAAIAIGYWDEIIAAYDFGVNYISSIDLSNAIQPFFNLKELIQQTILGIRTSLSKVVPPQFMTAIGLLGDHISNIGIVMSGFPIVAVVKGIAQAVYAFRSEIMNFVADISVAWTQLDSTTQTALLAIPAALAVAVAAIMLPVGAVTSGATMMIAGIATIGTALSRFHDEIIGFFDWWSGMWSAGGIVVQSAITVIGIAIIAGLLKTWATVRSNLRAGQLARECAQNPLMKCMIPSPNQKQQWKSFVNEFKQGTRGLALATNCNGFNCAKDITRSTQLLSKQSNTAHQAAESTKRSWTGALTGIGTSISNTFRNSWNAAVNYAQQSIAKTKSYISEAKFTGSGATDKRTKPILDRAEEMARERGVSRYTTGDEKSRRETEEFKRLKEEAAKQAQATRTLLQNLVADFSGTVKAYATKAADSVKAIASSISTGMGKFWDAGTQQFSKVAAAMENVVRSSTQKMGSIWGSIKQQSATAMTAAAEGTKRFMSGASTAIGQFWDSSVQRFSKVTAAVESAAKSSTQKMGSIWGSIKQQSATAMMAAAEGTKRFMSGASTAIGQFWDSSTQRFSKAASSMENVARATNQRMVGIWEAMKRQANTAISAVQASVQRYTQSARQSAPESSTPVPVPSGSNSTQEDQVKRQRDAMKDLGNEADKTADTVGRAHERMGESATVHTSRLKKVGIAFAAIAGLTFAFSGAANAADDLDSLTNSASLLDTAIAKLNSAWEWMKNNTEMLAMIGIGLLTSGLVDLGVIITTVTTSAGLLAAAFVGWKIGEKLYSEFTVVQESAMAVVGVFVELGNSIQQAYSDVTAIDFSSLGQSILDSISNVFTDGIPQITESLNSLWSGLGDVFTMPAELVISLADSLGTAIGEAMAAISMGNFAEAGALIVNGLIDGVQSVGNSLATAVGGVIKMAADAILPDSWAGPATVLIDGFVNSIRAGANFIIDSIQTGIQAAGSYISSVSWSGLGHDLLQGFIAVFSGGIIVSAVSGMMDGARNYLAGLSWSTQGQSLLQTLGAGIRAGAGLIIAAISGALNGVKNYIASIDLSAAGRAMISSLGSGISAAAANLRQQAMSVVQSVRNILPFSPPKDPASPLQDLEKSGSKIPEMMATGVKKGGDKLKDAVKEQAEKAAKEAEKAASEINDYVKSLEQESAAIGLSSEQLKMYELSQKGASDATLAHVQSLQNQITVKKELFDAEKRLREATLTSEQIKAEELRSKGISEANIQQIQSINALADAKKLLSETEGKLSEVGKTPEQIKLEELAERGVNQAILDQIKFKQVALAIESERQKLQQQIAVEGLSDHEKELEALKQQGATAEQLNSITKLRSQLEQKRAKTAIRGLDEELSFLKLSSVEQERLTVLKKYSGEFSNEAQQQEILEKYALIEAQKEQNKAQEEQKKLWTDVSNSATSYFDKIADGSMKAKDAFKEFAGDMGKTWTKTLADMAKQQLQGLDFGKMLGGGEGGGISGIFGSIKSLFSGGSGGIGGMFEGLKSSIGGLFSGGGGGGLFNGITGSISKLIPSTDGLTKSLGGLGGPVGMGALSAGMSLLSGDTTGAVSGLASLAGSMTPLGPLGGMAASALVSMVGIGAKWVREAEWITADIKGMTATFKKGYRETKDSMIGGGTRTGYEELGAEQLSKLNSEFKAIIDTVENVNQSLGNFKTELTGAFHFEDREGLGAEVLAKSMQDIQRQWIIDATDKMIVGIDDDPAIGQLSEQVAKIIQGRVSGLMDFFTDNVNAKLDFDMAVADSTWDGDLDRILGQFEVNSEMYHDKLTTGLTNYIGSLDLGDMGADEIQRNIAGHVAQMFHDIGVNDIPQSTFDELGSLLAARINDAILFIQNGVGDSVVTEDIGFFKTLREIVRNFDGSNDELQKFIQSMVELKNSTKVAGLDTNVLTESLINASGGVEKLSKSVSFFEDKFVTDAQKKSAQLQSSLSTVGGVMASLGKEAPKTRQQFTQLVQSTSQLGEKGTELTRKLLDSAPAFDTYYGFLEGLSGKTKLTFGQLQQDVTTSFSQLGLSVPATRQQFEELISSLDITTDSGKQLFSSLSQAKPALDEMYSAIENVFSIDAQSLGKDFVDTIFNAKSAEEAGQMMANKFAEQFYQQMVGSVMNSIAQSIFSGVVEPFLASSAQAAININEGGSIAGINLSNGSATAGVNLSQGGMVAGTQVSTGGTAAGAAVASGGEMAANSLATIIEDAKEKMKTMAAVIVELKGSGVLDELTSAISDIGSTAYTTFQATPVTTYTASYSQPSYEPSSSASAKVVDATESIADATESVAEKIDESLPSFGKLRSQIDILDQGLEGNAATLYELQQRYEGTDAAQLLAMNSSENLVDSIKNLTDEQLAAIAAQAGVNTGDYGIDISSDLLSAVQILQDTESELAQQEQERTDAMRESLKVVSEFKTGIADIVSPIQGAQKTLRDLGNEFLGTDITAQVMETDLAQIGTALEGIPNEQVVEFAEQYGMSVEDLTGKFAAGVEAVTQLQGILSEHLQKMGQIASGATDAEAELTRLGQIYGPELVQAIIGSGATQQQIAGYFAGLGEQGTVALAEQFGVGIEQFVTDSQSFVSAIGEVRTAESELAQQEQERADAMRESLKVVSEFKTGITDITSPIQGAQKTLRDLGNEFLGTDITAQAVGTNISQIGTALETIPNEQLVEFAEQYGMSVEDLTGKLAAGVEAIMQLQGILSEHLQKMGQIASGASDAETEINRLGQVYGTELVQAIVGSGATQQQIAGYFAGLGEQGTVALAEQFGVGIEQFVADSQSFVSAIGEVQNAEMEKANAEKEQATTLANSAAELNQQMKQTVTGMSDAQLNLEKLGEKYSVFSDYLSQTGLTANDVATKFKDLSAAELSALAEMANVKPEEFAADVSSYVGSMQTLEEEAANTAREAQEAAQASKNTVVDFRTEMEKLSSGMSDAEWTIQQTADSVKTFLKSIGSSSAEMRTGITGLSTKDLLAAAGDLNVDEFVSSASAYISALGSIEEANHEAEQERLKQQQEVAEETLRIQQDQAEKAAQLAKEQAEEIARITKERDDEIMKSIDSLFSTFEKLSEGIQSVQKSIQDDMLSFASSEQVAVRRQVELASLGTELSTFNGADINRVDDMEAITQKSDRYRQLIMEETDAKIKAIEEEKQIAQDAFNKQIEQYRDWANSMKNVMSTVSSDIEKLRGELNISGPSAIDIKSQLAEQFSNATDFDSQIQLAEQYRDAIQKSLDENIQAVEKARDERISALEQERETALENIKSQNEAAKQLRGELESIQDSIRGMAASVSDDIFKIQKDMGAQIQKDMGAPGTSAKSQLTKLGSIPSGMTANQANLDALEQRRALITAAMEEQIQLEEEKAQKEKDLQQSQIDHFKSLIDFSKELKGWIDDLAFSDLSTLKPVQMLKEAERQYQETLKKARSGDEEAKGNLTKIADEYLKQARDVYASSQDYTGIFEGVRSEISGLATTTEAEATRLQAELPLDNTLTGQNIGAIRQIQESAITQLQAVDAALNSMKADVTTQLASPSATPLPDNQLNEMLQAEEVRFNGLIANENINAEKQITAYKEGAVQELTTLNETLNSVYAQLEAQAEKQFDDTPFAQNIQAVQAAALLQLNQLGGFLVALDGGLKQSLSENVTYLAAGLSADLQAQVATRLDELISISREMLGTMGKEAPADKLGVLGSILSGYDSFSSQGVSSEILEKMQGKMVAALENYKQSSSGTFSAQQYENAIKYVGAITDSGTISEMLSQGIQKGSAEFWKLIEPEQTQSANKTAAVSSQTFLPQKPMSSSIFDFVPGGMAPAMSGMGSFDILSNLGSTGSGKQMQETLKQLVTATGSISVKLQELFDLGEKNNIERDQANFKRWQTFLLSQVKQQVLLLSPLQEIRDFFPLELQNNTLLLDSAIRESSVSIIAAIHENIAAQQAIQTSITSAMAQIQAPREKQKEEQEKETTKTKKVKTKADATFQTGTPYVPRNLNADLHEGEIVIDSASSEILRKYGITVNSDNTTKTGEKDSNQELKQLLQQLLVALEKNTQQSSQDSQKVKVAVEELENTVGRPIRRAIEENKIRVRN